MTKSDPKYTKTHQIAPFKIFSRWIYIYIYMDIYIYGYIRGVARIWQGGPRNIFFKFGNLHVARRHAAYGEAMGLGRGVRGHAPPPREFFSKWCNLVRFDVYLDQILSVKFFKNYHFLYKINKKKQFFISKIDILDTCLL